MKPVFEYQQYREYLRDYYDDQKLRKTGLTYSRFSAAAGIRSPNYLKLVIDGRRNLTDSNVARFAKALRLVDAEREFFEALVSFNQARTPVQRDFCEERLTRARERHGHGGAERVLTEHEFEALSDWRYHAILVLTNVRGFEERPAYICERLFHLVSEREVARILERLQDLGLLARDRNGRLRQTHRQIRTRPELSRTLARVFYEGLFARAEHAVRLTEPEDRELGTFIVGLSPEQVPELKRKVRKFMKELNDWALENPVPKQVYSLAFAGFPLTSPENRYERGHR